MEQDLYKYIKSIRHIIDASVNRIFPNTLKVNVGGKWSVLTNKWSKTPLINKWSNASSSHSNHGFKGSAYINSGYIYAPYIPLHRDDVHGALPSGSNAAIFDNYAVKIMNKDFYSTIRIED